MWTKVQKRSDMARPSCFDLERVMRTTTVGNESRQSARETDESK